MSLEYQRYGRNKETLVNSTYINSGEYRNKFDKITDNKDVNRMLYSKAKEMLQHRSGTMFEDMYWINMDTGFVVASVLDQQREQCIDYPNSIKNAIQGINLIVMHTHPQSMPPSVEDFNSAFGHGYMIGLVICHDGIVYAYTSKQHISPKLQRMYTERFLKVGYSEKEAQLKALEKLKCSYEIDFWEVK